MDRPPPGLQNPDQPIVLDTAALKLTESAISVDQRGVPVRPSPPRSALDPADWTSIRAEGHRMLDDMFDYLEHIQKRPVWQPMPPKVRQGFQQALPLAPSDLNSVHQEFLRSILPYSNGNVHPGFMGWVHGGGTATGMLAEMLAAGLNANLGGRDHAPIEVERQIVRWMRQLFGFPETASGLFVTGTSMANLISVVVARDWALGFEARRSGVAAGEKRLTGYTSSAAHGSLRKAFDCCGLGSDALRLVPVDDHHRIDLAAFCRILESDRKAGYSPFFLAGTAGTVDIGAIDNLCWFSGPRKRATSLVSCGWRLWSARHAGTRDRAASWPASKRPIRWRSIFINGGRCPTTPVSCWCATENCTAKPSRPLPHTSTGRRAGSPPAPPGHAISAPISRVDFERSRPGSR